MEGERRGAGHTSRIDAWQFRIRYDWQAWQLTVPSQQCNSAHSHYSAQYARTGMVAAEVSHAWMPGCVL